MLRKSRKQLTTRFLHRIILFLTSFSAGLALFFLYGNAQGFLDSTQKMILIILAGTSLLTVLLAMALILLEIIFLVIEKKKIYLGLLAICIFCLVLSLLFTLCTHAIILLSKGL
jgi:putative copper export protein